VSGAGFEPATPTVSRKWPGTVHKSRKRERGITLGDEESQHRQASDLDRNGIARPGTGVLLLCYLDGFLLGLVLINVSRHKSLISKTMTPENEMPRNVLNGPFPDFESGVSAGTALPVAYQRLELSGRPKPGPQPWKVASRISLGVLNVLSLLKASD